jgi:hypothetical protein
LSLHCQCKYDTPTCKREGKKDTYEFGKDPGTDSATMQVDLKEKGNAPIEAKAEKTIKPELDTMETGNQL